MRVDLSMRVFRKTHQTTLQLCSVHRLMVRLSETARVLSDKEKRKLKISEGVCIRAEPFDKLRINYSEPFDEAS